mmetsp:Transcript_11283/g.12398  ORF Transcript_11283/g.12398 Transcript_11283/m.12398 type:complete len:549 (-) Transcript_11283:209-1855(-)
MAVASLYVLFLAIFFVVSAAESTPTSSSKGLNWTFGTSLVNNVKDAWLDFVAPKIHNIPVLPEMTNEPLPGVHINMTDITLASIGLSSKNVDIAINKDSTVAGGSALDISATNVYLNITFNIEVTIGSFKPHIATGWFDFDEGAQISLGVAPFQTENKEWGLTDTHFTFTPGGFKLHTTSPFVSILLDLSKKLVEKLVATTMEGQVTGIFKKLIPVWSQELPAIKLTDSLGLDMAFSAMPEFNPDLGTITGSHVASFISLPNRDFPPVDGPTSKPLTPSAGDTIQLFVSQSFLNSALYLMNYDKMIKGYLNQKRLSLLGSAVPLSLTTEGVKVIFPNISSRMTPKCELTIGFESIDPYPLVGMIAGSNVINLTLNLKIYGGTVPGKSLSDPELCLADKTCVLMSSMDLSVELGIIIDADVVSGKGAGIQIQVAAVQINSLEGSKIDPVPGDNSNFPAIHKNLNNLLRLLLPNINEQIQSILTKLAEKIAPTLVDCGISIKNLTLDAAYGYATILAEPEFTIPPSYEKCFGSAQATADAIPALIAGVTE